MAAVSNSRQRGGEGMSWEHRRNRSEDNKQNFSLPYQVPSPPQSPLSQDEFVSAGTNPLPGRSIQAEFDHHADAVADESLSRRGYQQRPTGRGAPPNSEHTGSTAAPRMRQPSHPEGRQERSYNSASAPRSAKKWNTDRSRDDESNWVHRDKLIALEIQDHIDRGERVPKALLEAQAQAAGGGNYYSNRQDAQNELTENNLHRLASTPPGDDHMDEEEGYIPDDPRTPEEIAADAKAGNSGAGYYSPRSQSGASRIPVSKTGTRSRSQSVGSQVLLDEVDGPETPPSPSQQRRANKSHSRKASGTERSIKSRAASGSASRPTTANDTPRGVYPADGPAPWLNDIYKPDPSLPPDQQLLPTHAKRMHQEQLAREEAEKQRQQEKIDRERQRELDRERDRLEQEKERELRRKAAAERAAAEKAREEEAIAQQREVRADQERMEIEKPPLQQPNQQAQFPERFDSMKPAAPPTPSGASEHGGYRTMPKVQGHPSTQGQNVRNQQAMLVQDPDAAAQKKGCSCCLVM